ncbi:MAG: hypothetical protein AAFU73_01085 [Planctomycetota bacterium]
METLIPCAQMSLARIKTVTATATLLILGTLAVDVVYPAPKAKLGRAAALDAQARLQNASFADGSLASYVADQLRARSRTQFATVPFWSAALLRWGRHGNEGVVVGKDDWLFLRPRTTIPPEMRAAGAGLIAAYTAAMERRLAAHGADYAPALLPRKAVIAREAVPRGIDVYDRFERDLEAAMERRGVGYVPLLDRWLDLAPEAVYRTTDTHWDLGGRVAFAKALRERFQDHAMPKLDVPFKIAAFESQSDLLGRLGVRGVDAALRIVKQRPHHSAYINQAALYGALGGSPTDRVIAQVGTSFTKTHDLGGVVSYVLGRHAYVVGYGGVTPAEPLHRLIGNAGLDGLPEKIVHEMPVSLIVAALNNGGEGRKWIARGFHAVPNMGVSILDEATDGVVMRTQTPEVNTRLFVEAGEVLTSGDGVVSVRIDAANGAPFRLRALTGKFALNASRSNGDRPIEIPVLAPGATSAPLRVIALDEATRRMDLDMTLVTDADLGRIQPARPTGVEGPLEFELDPDLEVGDFTTLVVRGALIGAFEVVAEGTDDEGQPLALTWPFEGARARLAILNANAFAGGRIDRVILRGPSIQDVQVGLAPWLGGANQ